MKQEQILVYALIGAAKCVEQALTLTAREGHIASQRELQEQLEALAR